MYTPVSVVQAVNSCIELIIRANSSEQKIIFFKMMFIDAANRKNCFPFFKIREVPFSSIIGQVEPFWAAYPFIISFKPRNYLGNLVSNQFIIAAQNFPVNGQPIVKISMPQTANNLRLGHEILTSWL